MPKKLCASWRSKVQPQTVVTLCQPAQGGNHANATATASLLMSIQDAYIRLTFLAVTSYTYT